MFSDVFTQKDRDSLKETIYSSTIKDVKITLSKSVLDVSDFCRLISPAAAGFLEDMAKVSQRLTLQRFGKTMQLYVPLYLSNECSNICTYCGFSFGNKIDRKTLTNQEIIREVNAIKQMGFDHILLVTGESSKKVGVDYLKNAINLLRDSFSNISIEVQPLETEDYKLLHTAGVHAVLVYQETYDPIAYKIHHPKGKKSNYNYRLNTPDRIGKAGIHKIGLGVLLGLSDWRADAAALAMHLAYLEKVYWQSRYSVSFPRLRPATGLSNIAECITERELVQLICAYRIFRPDLELSLSTRESKYFRDNVMSLGVTAMSAGSKTEPGGYAVNSGALKQFETDDERSPADVVEVIRSKGYEPVWKDWDKSFDKAANG